MVSSLFSRARTAGIVLSAAACLSAAGAASAQLRIVTWNISNYSGGRTADLSNVLFGTSGPVTMNPDVIATQEFISQAAVNAFLAMLNAAQPGQWAAAPFIDGADTDCGFFYRTSKVDFLGVTTTAVGSSAPTNQPRNTYRYDIRLKNYASSGATLALYSVHMKAQESGTEDDNRRFVEAQRLRDNAEGIDTNGPGSGLPAGYRFLMCGDTNIQTSSDIAYVELTGSQPNNSGRLFDPINTPGNWNNNGAFRFVHTQDPAGPGGMDDRHDQILLCQPLLGPDGFSYIGNPAIPYSTTTWNDPNHSYRAWGNDGSSYNISLTVAGNTFVGPGIAQSLINACNGAGHLPVVLDLRVPAKSAGDTIIDFGTVPLGSIASAPLSVVNAGDTSLWTAAGIDDLDYTLAASGGFSAAAGSFSALPGAPANIHFLSMDTSTPGPRTGTVTVTSDDPDQPVRLVTLMGMVMAQPPACPGDADGDGLVGLSDIAAVIGSWGQSLPPGTPPDLDASGDVGLGDIAAVIANWGASCP